jgi:hypothetical protein
VWLRDVGNQVDGWKGLRVANFQKGLDAYRLDQPRARALPLTPTIASPGEFDEVRAAPSGSPNALRSRIAPRSIESIAQELDLYLCAHWLIRQSALAGGERPFKRPHIIIQRRLALEWCCSELAWDEVELYT